MNRADPLAGVAAVSFDLDGTLYSTRGFRRRVVGEAARQVVGRGSAAPFADLGTLRRAYRRAEAARRRGGRLDDDRADNWADDGADDRADDWATSKAARLAAEGRLLLPALRRIGPAPGVLALLEVLRRRVGRVVVVSDYEPEAKLEALGLGGRFDGAYAAEEVGRLKPDPAVFRRALADLRIPPEALLHFGDRAETDGAAAAAAGCGALIRGRDFESFARLGAVLDAPA